MNKYKKALWLVAGLGILSVPLSFKAFAQNNILYERPTMMALSQLYWALNKFDIDDVEAVDNFMLINECNIYKEFHHNEFEWKPIRESTRAFLKNNMEMFPVRFEIEQPLLLGEYDFDDQQIDVHKSYKIDNIKLFEVLTPQYQQDVCTITYQDEIKGYPRGVVVEIAEPITLTHIKMTPKEAQAYLDFKKESKFVSGTKERGKSTFAVRRDAYIIMKVKFFSVKGEEIAYSGGRLTRVLAALESLEVYADKDRRYLLYSKNYRNQETGSSAEEILWKRVQERLKKKRAEEAEKAKIEAEKKAEQEKKKAAEAQG